MPNKPRRKPGVRRGQRVNRYLRIVQLAVQAIARREHAAAAFRAEQPADQRHVAQQRIEEIRGHDRALQVRDCASRSIRPWAVSPSDGLNARASASSSTSSDSVNGATILVNASPGPRSTSTNPYNVIAWSSLPSAAARGDAEIGQLGRALQWMARAGIVIGAADRQRAALHRVGHVRAPAADRRPWRRSPRVAGPPVRPICSANGPWSRVAPSTRRRRNTLPSFSARTVTRREHKAMRHQDAIEMRVERPGRPGRRFRLRAVARRVAGRASRADRSSIGPLTRTAMGPRAARREAAPTPAPRCGQASGGPAGPPKCGRRRTAALPRSGNPSPLASIPSMPSSRSCCSRSLRRRVRAALPAACASPAALRSASRRSGRHRPTRCRCRRVARVSTACRSTGPASKSVASSPAAASCLASGRPVTVTRCSTCVGGPARKSIAASSAGGNAGQQRLPLHRQAVVVRRDIERAAVRSCPADTRRRGAHCRCGRDVDGDVVHGHRWSSGRVAATSPPRRRRDPSG